MLELPGTAGLQPGTTVGGRFKVDALLGKGGMGAVYAARHTVTGREVALKVLKVVDEGKSERVRRFLREARAATAIRHPNVIEVLDVFADDSGKPIIVMERLHGETLSAYRKRAGLV